ncbi:MAG: FeoB-associated Cys-rich membrane protein [Bacteroidales bacterium]|nr:FeoB-associated Cys-rich membrane protein [Bacteroidales bacterium]
MNLATAIVLGLVLAAAVAAVVFMIHRRKKSGSSVCSGCSLRSLCQRKDK